LEGGLGEFLSNYTVYQCLTRLAAAAKSRPSQFGHGGDNRVGVLDASALAFPPERDSTKSGGNLAATRHLSFGDSPLFSNYL